MSTTRTKNKTGGLPPVFHVTEDNDLYKQHLLNWLGHLNYTKDIKDCRLYLTKFIKTHRPEYESKLSAIKDSCIITTYGWIAKMCLEGCVLKPSDVNRIYDYIDYYSALETRPVLQSDKKTVDELYNFIDKLVDDLIISRYKLQPHSIVYELKQYQKAELLDAIEYLNTIKTNSVIDYSNSEGHWITNAELNRYIKYIEFYINDIQAFIDAKPQRKKSKKIVDKLKLTQHLKYIDTHILYQCLNASDIINAKYVVLYDINSKYVTVVTSNTGFTIKGTTLENVTSSITKLLRDDNIIRDICNMNKSQIRVALDKHGTGDITSKPRITKNTIILKII